MTRHGGFSLFEIVMVLSISAILFALAIPNLRDVLLKAHDDVLLNDLLQALQLAKSAAKTNGRAVILCGNLDNKNCQDTWDRGWLVMFADVIEGRAHDHEQIIAVHDSTIDRGHLYWRSFPVFRKHLLFLPTGWMQQDNGTFWYCRRGALIFAVIINNAGRTRTAYPNETGQIQDAHGRTLTCNETHQH